MAANARTTAKKRTTKPKAAPTVAEDFEPVRLTSKPADVDRIVLFYVDDTEYSIPKRVGRNHGLRYLRTMRKQGEALAAQELLEVLIGEDGYQALMDCDDLEDDQLDQIMNRLRDMALGEVEDEEGKAKGR
jgi:tetrahydromethanopterin S-methyltransferase subunit G